jgi:hypothetical protein
MVHCRSSKLNLRVFLVSMYLYLQKTCQILCVKPSDADTPIPSVSLPSFSRNNEEYAVGAIIERVSDSFDLYATVFLLCHQLKLPLDKRRRNSLLFPSWISALSSFEETEYHSFGVRSGASNFTCRIRHMDGGSYYTVEGEFVPKGITSNSEGELHLDILRCKMQDTERAYMELAGSSEELEIEIFEGTYPLIRFMIPWVSRTTANDRPGNAKNFDSTLNAWKGFNRSAPGVWSNDRLHLCVPEWGDSPNKVTLPRLLEFLQHHLLLGVDHIFMSFRTEENEDFFLWNYLDSFISEGSVTVNKMTDYGLDGLHR